MKLVFATHNENKVKEIACLLPSHYEIVTLNDIGILNEIQETALTLDGNATIKAESIYKASGMNCFADDTGLEVESLDGAPGVYSARYAGLHKNAADNIKKLLKELDSFENRKAQFRTVICLIICGEKYFFEGKIVGKIEKEPRGEGGFGYDPIFTPDGFENTFAEMALEKKSKMSHRGLAIDKMIHFLKLLK
jgi:XTP/dITP diphosphohydrolase